MSAGKMAAQCAHAAIRAFLDTGPTVRNAWLKAGETKIVLQAKSDIELRELWAKAKNAGLPAVLIHDEGRTEVPPGSCTVLGIGPGELDSVTGHLPLYKDHS